MSNSIPDDFYYLEDVPWTMYFDEGPRLAWCLLAQPLRISA